MSYRGGRAAVFVITPKGHIALTLAGATAPAGLAELYRAVNRSLG